MKTFTNAISGQASSNNGTPLSWTGCKAESRDEVFFIDRLKVTRVPGHSKPWNVSKEHGYFSMSLCELAIKLGYAD